MDQATATTTTAPPRTDTFAHAHAVAGIVVAELGHELPFAVELDEDFPAGWRAHLKFRQSRARGLLSFAALVDVPITRAVVESGIHLEVLVRIQDVEVRGSALVSPETAAELEGAPTPVDPALEAEAEIAPSAPPGADVAAQEAVVIPVVPPLTELLNVEEPARCVRCGCTEDQACEGGCYWVPNRQLIDFCSACASAEELQAMTYTAEIADGGE
ncbi:hypothetical protein ABTY96_46730 [Streptomyces sp. NPDC096057]|uniref:hypothetical protein n=1 Tax=Streptomyces sp. NPDC096057 TaxID=3155543 RepID=UPI003330A8B9